MPDLPVAFIEPRYRIAPCFSAGDLNSARQPRGFSLIELVIAVAIGAILLTVGIPMMRRMLDSKHVQASQERLRTFLAEARETARAHGNTVVGVVGGGSFNDCAELRSTVVGTNAYTRTFTPDSGVSLRGGPIFPCFVITASGDFDLRQGGYLGLQGTYPDHSAYVTFNSTGTTTAVSATPVTQASVDMLGADSKQIINEVGWNGGTGELGGVAAITAGNCETSPSPTPEGRTGITDSVRMMPVQVQELSPPASVSQ